LLEQVPAEEPLLTVTGDGSYDTQLVHAAVIRRNATPIIPPRRNARVRKGDAFARRNAASAACKRFGRKLWISWSGCHRRSLVETKMNCVKWLGERARSRTFERKVNELHIRAAIAITHDVSEVVWSAMEAGARLSKGRSLIPAMQ